MLCLNLLSRPPSPFSRTLLPHPHRVLEGGEADVDTEESTGAAAMPAEMPEAARDVLADAQGYELMLDSLDKALTSSPWELSIRKEAQRDWNRLQIDQRLLVYKKLVEISEGRWATSGTTQRLVFASDDLAGLELWRTKWSAAGRIVFQVTAEFSDRNQRWQEVARVWSISAQHSKYERDVRLIQVSYRKSLQIKSKTKLVPIGGGPGAATAPEVYDKTRPRQPKFFIETTAANGEGATEAVRAGVIEYLPPAQTSASQYSLQKFNVLSAAVAKAILKLDALEKHVDFPFRVSPTESAIIERSSCTSTVLVGRSGTGKTTCAVFRLAARWYLKFKAGDPFREVFVTQSATLRAEVRKAFTRFRNGLLMGEANGAQELRTDEARSFPSYRDVPENAFPLFLSAREHLMMLDGALGPDAFYRRGPDGRPLNEERDWAEMAMGAMDIEIDLNAALELELEDEFVDEAAALEADDNAPPRPDDLGEGVPPPPGAEPTTGDRPMQIMSTILRFEDFADPAFYSGLLSIAGLSPVEAKGLEASLVYAEINSYIKGSALALETEAGHLSLREYLELGRKLASNFGESSVKRELVYRVYEAYERRKRSLGAHDQMDFIRHLYVHFKRSGYGGALIDGLYRDEVQDFAEAELLLDLRVVTDQNNLFFCGDSAQVKRNEMNTD